MGKPIQKEESAPNPSVAKTEKSPLSEPTSEQRGNTAEGITKRADKPSVRGELRQIRESRKAQEKEKRKPCAGARRAIRKYKAFHKKDGA